MTDQPTDPADEQHDDDGPRWTGWVPPENPPVRVNPDTGEEWTQEYDDYGNEYPPPWEVVGGDTIDD